MERILRLTLHKKAFAVMMTGEKSVEYRKPSKWIISRLKKQYDFVEFVNGYGAHRPRFMCEYLGWEKVPSSFEVQWNDLHVTVETGDICIYLGPITQPPRFKKLD